LREKDRDENIYRRLCDMEWRWEVTNNAEPCRLGGMGVMRIESYNATNGYDENLIAGADPELYTRIKQAGWSLHVLDTDMGIHDSGMLSFNQWWIRNIKSGFGFANGQLTGAWSKERRSAIFWGGLPIIALITMCFFPIAAFLLLLFVLKSWHIWFGPAKRAFSNDDRWLYAASCMVSKVPQLIGIVKYYMRKQNRQSATVIQYK